MHTLRFRILALAALLVIVTQVATMLTVLATANREVDRNARITLGSAHSMFDQVFAGESDRLANAGQLIADNERFRRAVLQRDKSGLAAQLDEHRQRTGTDLAFVMDREGRLLAAAGVADAGSTPPLARLATAATDEGRNPLLPVTAVVGEQAYALVLTAVRGKNTEAWLATGFAVNDALASRHGRFVSLPLTFVGDPEGRPTVLGSTLGEVDRAELLRRLWTGADSPQVQHVEIAGRPQLALLEPLSPGLTDVSVLITLSLDEAMAPYLVLRNSVLLLGTLFLLLALAGGALLAKAVTRPVSALARAARRIRAGDYSQPVVVDTRGELAELANTLNSMQESVAGREERISYQARFDALTGLPNRSHALERLGNALQHAETCGERVSVLVLELNGLAGVSSTLGHELGDALVRQAAERLRGALETRHVLARLEGAQFLAVLDGLAREPAEELAASLLRVVRGGLSVRGVNVSADAVAGLAEFPGHGRDAEQLLQRAQLARNLAQDADVDLRVYEDGNDQQHARKLTILGDLRRAARQDELALRVQPMVDLGTGQVCGAEALVHWRHRALGYLPPREFIPLAEKSGNMGLITRWALGAAVRECRRWVAEGLDLPVSVNLSSLDLEDQNLPYVVSEALRNHDLDPRYLMLEITEEAVVRDFDSASVILRCLRDLGVRISLDDFGTGYSSLVQLRHLPVNEIKIDGSFVKSLPTDMDDAAIVSATIRLAHDLGLEVLAEGVETPEALRWLSERRCQRVQGDLISMPLATEDFARWVRDYQAAAPARPFGRAALGRAMRRQPSGPARVLAERSLG